MTRSASTPRLTITFFYYILLLVAASVAGPPPADPASGRAFAIASLLLVAAACLGRIWCSAFIAGYKDARLVTEGPYSICRHPLYALSFVGGIGLGLATRSLTLTAVTAVFLAVILSLAARAEERRQAQMHGPAFSAYAQATPRWWPRWGNYRGVPRFDLDPRIYGKAFLDAAAFLFLYVLLDTARALRDAGVLPTLLRLP